MKGEKIKGKLKLNNLDYIPNIGHEIGEKFIFVGYTVFCVLKILLGWECGRRTERYIYSEADVSKNILENAFSVILSHFLRKSIFVLNWK
jgi:hypothetical protein